MRIEEIEKSDSYGNDVESLFEKVINEDLSPTELGNTLVDIANAGNSIVINYRHVLDVMVIKENLNINRSVKNLTWLIGGLTLINVVLVAITTYFVID